MSLAVAVGKSDHALGLENAPVTLVEYGDFQCPYCADAHSMLKSIAASMGPTLRLVFRHMPNSEMHPHAHFAAEAAEAAGAQGKFWAMHDAIYTRQSDLGVELVQSLGRELNLDVARFAEDLEARRYLPRVQRDFMGGMRSGVAATPAFFINAERYEGNLSERSLMAALLRASP
jgi:protein-disulfide isomerase